MQNVKRHNKGVFPKTLKQRQLMHLHFPNSTQASVRVMQPLKHKAEKIILSCLLQEVHIPRLITPAEKGRDLEPRVIDAYIIQCQAEAQEGKVAPGLQHYTCNFTAL